MKQWFIVDIKTGKPLETTNRNTKFDCIYWFVEPEILRSSGDDYILELWEEISKRENVTVKGFTLIEEKNL